MSEAHDRSSGLRAAVSPSHAHAHAHGLSPLVQLLPTGYRDVQPFQRGQGWHSNGNSNGAGKLAAGKMRRPRGERVVFPTIPGQQDVTQLHAIDGPSATTVQSDELEADAYREEEDDQCHLSDGLPMESGRAAILTKRRTPAPPVSAGPTPPAMPRRPSSRPSTDNNQRGSSPAGFRGRSVVPAASVASPLPLPSTSPSPRRMRRSTTADTAHAVVEESEEPPPDAETMERLWHEYAERTKNTTRTVDRETYHRKMHQRYSESKALRERVVALERELEAVRRERDEVLDTSRRHLQRVVLGKWKDKGDDAVQDDEDNSYSNGPVTLTEDTPGDAEVTSRGASASTTMLKFKTKGSPAPASDPEEVTYREKYFRVERSFANAKEEIALVKARLLARHESDENTIQELRAQFKLETQAGSALASQLRETSAAFKAVTEQLVVSQVALQQTELEKRIVLEQVHAETQQLISDHKRKEMQTRIKAAVRTLGKEALHQRMEALHARVLTAEHRMRAAQLQVHALQSERDQQQQQLDRILSSRELKYHCLAPQDGGIMGILGRAHTLFHGTRNVSGGHFLLVHMLYEDNRLSIGSRDHSTSNTHSRSETKSNNTLTTELEDGFCMHMLVYEARTAQDDYLTFHLRDIRRLVPDSDKFLAPHADRRVERFLELAELLFAQCHIGYKNGHLILTENPRNPLLSSSAQRQEVTIYRGTRFVSVHVLSKIPPEIDSDAINVSDTDTLVDMVVNEVYAPATSQLWWIEIKATPLEYVTQDGEYLLRIDMQQLCAVCATFGSYRPSESISSVDGHIVAEHEIFGIHEELLRPLLDMIELQLTMDGHGGKCQRANLVLAGQSSDAKIDIDNPCELAIAENVHNNEGFPAIDNEREPKETRPVHEARSVLRHRSIVCVDDIFYCLHIQEMWDGELTLHISMEEPDDDAHRYHTVLHEVQLDRIARHLTRSMHGDGEFNSEGIEDGLPVHLHASLCKLLKKHIRPVRDSEGKQGEESKRTSSHEGISLTSLFDEIALVAAKEERAIDYVALRTSQRLFGAKIDQVCIVGGGKANHISADTVHELVADLHDSTLTTVRRKRLGCRCLTTGNFIFVTVFVGLTSISELVAIAMAPIREDQAASSQQARLAVTRLPVQQALEFLGLRVFDQS